MAWTVKLIVVLLEVSFEKTVQFLFHGSGFRHGCVKIEKKDVFYVSLRFQTPITLVQLHIESCKMAHFGGTVVPALGDPRRERPPALYGHVINAPTDTFQR